MRPGHRTSNESVRIVMLGGPGPDGAPIDLVRTWREVAQAHPKAARWRGFFGRPVVGMAEGAYGGDLLDDRVAQAIERCLMYQIGSLRWCGRVAWLPLPIWYEVPRGTAADRNTLNVLASSVLRSVVAYASGLGDRESGLREIILSDLACGFEVAAEWVARGEPLAPPNNPFVRYLQKADDGWQAERQ